MKLRRILKPFVLCFFVCITVVLGPRPFADVEDVSITNDNGGNAVAGDQQSLIIRKAVNQVLPTDHGLMLVHPRYTVNFTDSKLMFQPHAGPQWVWETDENSTHPKYDSQALRISYDREHWTEEYILKENSIEQQFVVSKPFLKKGEPLVVTGTIASSGEFTSANEKWTWKDSEGEITLGKVFAFDGDHRPIPATMKVEADRYSIEILFDDLANAVYPVTIDPEIGTNDFRISFMGGSGDAVNYSVFNPAIAYSSTYNVYLVVWEGVITGEREIYGRLVSGATGDLLDSNPGAGEELQISDMNGSATTAYGAFEPDVVSSGAEFFVVWHGDDGRNGMVDNEFEIFGQRISADPTKLGEKPVSMAKLSTTGANGNALLGAFEPSVTFNDTNDLYMVVWYADISVDDDYEIYSQHVALNGSLSGTQGTVSAMGFGAFSPKVVWNSNPLNNEYMVAFFGDHTVDNEFEVYAHRLNGTTGSELGLDVRVSDMGPDGNISYSVANPAIAYNSTSNNYLIVWQGDDNTAPLIDEENEIFGQLVTAAGTESGTDFRISDMGNDGSAAFDAINPKVAYDPNLQQFLVTWHGDDNTGSVIDGENEVYLQLLDNTGAAIGTNDYRLSDAGDLGNTNYAATSGAVAYNPTESEYLIVWRGDDNSTITIDNENEVWGQLFANLDSEPTAQPTLPVFSAITPNSLTCTFTAAAGPPDGYIALRKAVSSPTDLPVDGTAYTVGSTIGTSTVAYVGSAATFNQSSLAANTTYFYDIFAYNGVNSSINYRTASPLEGSSTTLAAEPGTQASNITFTAFGTNSVSLNFTNGNGTSRLVVAKAGAAVDVLPADATAYTANNTFGSGTNLGSSNFAVGAGSGPITITGLSLATVYHFRVFELNGSGAQTNYNTATATNNPRSISTLSAEPTGQPSVINFSAVTNTTTTVGYTAASGPPSGYIAIRKAGSAPVVGTDLPVDGTAYTAGNTIGGSTVAFVGSAASFAQSGLTAATEYYYLIMSYNGASANINYFTTSPLAGSKFTLSNEPAAPTALVFSNPTTSTLNLSFTAAAGPPTGYLILRKTGSNPTDVPADATAYSVGNTIGTSTVVSIGAGTTFNDTGLTANTVYFYDVYSYNGSAATLNYSSTPLEGNRSTAQPEPTAQPTSLVFSAVTETSMTSSFTAATGTPAGYIVLRRAGAAATDLPADGTAYTAGNTIGSSTVVSSGTSVSISNTGLTAGTVYHYAVYSFNGSGSSTNYLTTGALTGQKITLPAVPTGFVDNDKTSAYFRLVWTAVTGATKYELDVSTVANFATFVGAYNSLEVTGTTQDVVGLAASTQYFCRLRAVNDSGESGNASVTVVTEAGGNVIAFENYNASLQGANTKLSITVAGGSGPRTVKFFSRGITAEEFSPPTTLTSATATYETTVTPAMHDDMGLEYYFTAEDGSGSTRFPSDNSLYLYRSIAGTTINDLPSGGQLSDYRIVSLPYKLPSAGTLAVFAAMGTIDKKKWRFIRYENGKNHDYIGVIEQGKGYWYNAVEDFDIVLGSGTAPENNQDTPFELELNQGWNQIGNPYPFDISWSDVLTSNPGVAVGALNVYGGSGFAESDGLKKHSGGFVFAETSGTLVFPVILSGGLGGRRASNTITNTKLDQPEWFVPLSLSQGTTEISTIGFGMHPSASESKDLYDEISAPRIFNFLDMRTPHEEYFNTWFSRDVVPTNKQYVWSFSAGSSLNEKMTLSWNPERFGNNTSKLYLFDMTEQVFTDMKMYNQYIFLGSDSDRQFKIVYALDEADFDPGITWLGRVYPNPASGHATIPVVVKDSAPVKVAIRDMLGKPVKVLMNQQAEAGVYNLEWNGDSENSSTVTNGMYLVYLEVAGKVRSVQKVILVSR